MRLPALITLIIFALATAGCMAPTPLSTTYQNKPQQTMQTVQHWDVLAADIADIVRDAMTVRPDIVNVPIYLERSDSQRSQFSKTFQELLTAQLVSRGLHVSDGKPTPLTMEYKVMLVKHRGLYTRPPIGTFTVLPLGVLAVRNLHINPLLYSALGLGVLLDAGVGMVGITSEHEVVISVSLTFNNQYVVYQTSYYYINDKNWSEYADGAYRNSVSVRAVGD